MLTKDDRPLILLRLLDSDVQQQVLEFLPPEQANGLRRGLASASAHDAVDWSLESSVIDEFEMMLAFLKSHAPPPPPPPSAVQLQEAEESAVATGGSPAPGKKFIPSDDPLADLERMPAQQLGLTLLAEQPRTIAILLAKVSGARTAELLGFFKDDLKQAVIKELGRESIAHPTLFDRLARATIQRAVAAADGPPVEQSDRVGKLIEILRSLDKAQRGPMLEALEAEDPELAGKLAESLYKFEDLSTTEDRVIQKILGQVESSTLATALFKVDDAILQKVLKNLSRRAQQSLQEELQLQTHVATSKVTQARTAIAQIMAKLAREEDA